MTQKLLNPDQVASVNSMLAFLEDPLQKFFVLEGHAGTGKTFSILEFARKCKGRLVFTAPTNKATKVLRDTVTSDEYRPECLTIYKLLNLKLETNGEVKELSFPECDIDLSRYAAVVVDEGSMISEKLFKFIEKIANDQGIKFIFMGDPYQLPPVKEPRSLIWTIPAAKAKLTKIMRFDNQILTLTDSIRKKIDHPAPSFLPTNDHSEDEGVWAMSGQDLLAKVDRFAANGDFSLPNGAKALAWRNATVDKLNERIRSRIFEDAAETKWLVGDRLIVMEPAKSLNDEIIATTDEEGIVTKVETSFHPVWREYKTWVIFVTTDMNEVIRLETLHEDSQLLFEATLQNYKNEALLDRRRWKDYWAFYESFHRVRHAYAITVHRSQGSTYETAFVLWKDVLANFNRREAFQCLYVATSRPKKRLFLGG